MNNIISFFIFIVIAVSSLLLPIIKVGFHLKLGISIIPVILTIILYVKNIKLFVPALFFSINAILSPFMFLIMEKYKLYFPQINFLLPIALYLIIVLNIRRFKREINWLKTGSFDKITFILTLIVIISSAIGLIIWAFLIEDDLTKYRRFIPDTSIALFAAYGIAFPIFNSIFEELMARAILFDGFSAIFRKAFPVILFQAIIFALWHYQGFPGGFIGVIMVFIWSIFLGTIRYRAKGILPPMAAHFFADLTIAIILFFVLILPNK